jgi:hypothetical protein
VEIEDTRAIASQPAVLPSFPTFSGTKAANDRDIPFARYFKYHDFDSEQDFSSNDEVNSNFQGAFNASPSTISTQNIQKTAQQKHPAHFITAGMDRRAPVA